METFVTKEVKEILHDMAEYSEKNMICPFGEEELMKEYTLALKTEDYRIFGSILYAIIHDYKRQSKDELENSDEAILLLDILSIKDNKFKQILEGACNIAGLSKTVMEDLKENMSDDWRIWLAPDTEETVQDKKQLKRKEKISFFCILIGCIIINTQIAVRDIRYLFGIIGSIILYFISISSLPFHRFWNDMIPVPFLIAMWLCYIK